MTLTHLEKELAAAREEITANKAMIAALRKTTGDH